MDSCGYSEFWFMKVLTGVYTAMERDGQGKEGPLTSTGFSQCWIGVPFLRRKWF